MLFTWRIAVAVALLLPLAALWVWLLWEMHRLEHLEAHESPQTWAERMEREATGRAAVCLGPATHPPRTFRELRALSDEELRELIDRQTKAPLVEGA